ncbi:MAG: hypothetical protein N2517_02280 [Ignavibacteria bacterium]|nr:hypothetical protein [Ignavibacteria bacterium]
MAKTKVQSKDIKPKEQSKSPKEKEKLKQQQEATFKKRIKKEKKRLDKLVSFPFRALFIIGSVIGIVYFLYNFYFEMNSLIVSILKGFLLFVFIYVGLGLLFFIWFLIVANARRREEIEKSKEEDFNNEKGKPHLEGIYERELLLKQAEEKREQEVRRLREQLSQSKAQSSPPTSSSENFEVM